MKAFSVFDKKASAYGVPFFEKNAGMALRSFEQLVGDDRSLVYKYPEDFALYQLADFDDNSGLLVSNENPVHVANATEFVKEVNKD